MKNKMKKPAEEKQKTTKVKEKKPVVKTKSIEKKKDKKPKAKKKKVMQVKKRHVHKKQKALEQKRAKLAVKARQTKWAPVWVVLKKYGMGKRIHPSTTTRHRRNWRRTKLHIKPRKQRKSHFG